jgi:hypothetical protein
MSHNMFHGALITINTSESCVFSDYILLSGCSQLEDLVQCSVTVMSDLFVYEGQFPYLEFCAGRKPSDVNESRVFLHHSSTLSFYATKLLLLTQ